MKSNPVLISYPELRKTFDIYNSIKKDHQVIIVSDKGLLSRLILSLIYFKKIYYAKDYKKNFFYLVNDICKANKIESMVYIPIEEDLTIEVIKNKNNFLIYNLPSLKNFNIARNKKKMTQFCIEHEIYVPKVFSFLEIENQSKFPYKLIAKKSVSSGSRGIYFINSKKEFNDFSKAVNPDEWIVQKKLNNPEKVYGAFFLFYKGKKISYYGHLRKRTYPQTGGVTVKSILNMNSEAEEIGANILRLLDWSGIAMIEFMYDEDTGNIAFIEINPRAWGSILLSRFCGANILDDYINLTLEDFSALGVKKNINSNASIRWIFPYDFFNLIHRKINLKEFFQFNKDTAIINYSSSNFFQSFLFHLFLVIENFIKFYKK